VYRSHGARIKLTLEDCVTGMEQSYAAPQDATIIRSKGEICRRNGLKIAVNEAAVQDAQSNQRRKEYAKGIG